MLDALIFFVYMKGIMEDHPIGTDRNCGRNPGLKRMKD